MRVLVAGATGAIGRQLVPRLVEAGHEVVGMTRDEGKGDAVRALGARPVVADALDPDQVAAAVAAAEPEAIVYQLTAIASATGLRNLDRAFAPTNRLRTEGTDHLLSAARAAGVRRFVAQSFAPWAYARVGGPVKDEDAPPEHDPPATVRETVAAIRHLERAVVEADGIDGIVLRYGAFYGPHTSMAPGGEQLEAIRKRQFPVVGKAGGIMSMIHVADAAEATVAALERGRPGIYNIVDDDPAPVSEWLPAIARTVGAKPPRRVPRWLGRLFAGEALTVMMTEVRGSSNAKATRELDWQPAHPSWREGIAETVA